MKVFMKVKSLRDELERVLKLLEEVQSHLPNQGCNECFEATCIVEELLEDMKGDYDEPVQA